MLPDHLHAVLTLPPGDVELARRWRQVRADLSRWHRLGKHNSPWQRQASFWQRRSWHFAIEDAHEYQRYCDYIHYDPVHHGLCRSPCEWSPSSFARHVALARYAPDWGSDGVPPGLEMLLAQEPG